MKNNSSIYPCPICGNDMFIVGVNSKGKKIGSCGHTWKFRGTKASKMIDRKYVVTKNGLELKQNV